MRHALTHLRFALRLLAKTPGQSLLAVVALGLGIGLTGTAFSVVYGAAIKGLPFERSERIMVIERLSQKHVGSRSDGVANRVHQLADWAERQRSFEGIGAFAMTGVNLSSAGSLPERVPAALVSPNTFALLRVRPLAGRVFSSGDGRPGAPRVALIGYAIWKNRFGGDPATVGRAVQVNGQLTTVIGIMPERFGFPVRQSLWLPLDTDPLQSPRGQGTALTVFGRLRDDASAASARAEFDALGQSLALQHPDEYAATAAVVKPYWRKFLGSEGSVLSLYSMLAAVSGVLLIACANVANLLLARAVARTRELAVRVALGASRGQIVAHVFAESAVLAAAGGGLGLGLAWAGVAAFRRVAVTTNPPFWMEFTVSIPVVAFVLGLVIVAALASGLVPAWRSSRPDVNQVLNDASRGTSSVRLGHFGRMLIGAQLALSMAVLIPSASMIKAIVGLAARDYGFAIDDVFTGYVSLPASGYPDDRSRLTFYRELERRLSVSPGARAAALASSLPGENDARLPFEIDGQAAMPERDRPFAPAITVSTGFFEAYGVWPATGRTFLATDDADAPAVAVVNRRFVAKFIPDGRAVGRRIRFVPDGAEPAPWREIVGVVPDMFLGGTDLDRDWGVYVPLEQNPARALNVVLRGPDPPDALARRIRESVAGIDQGLAVGSMQSMQEVIFLATWQTRLFGSLFATFGMASLFLSAVGIYGVVSFSTGQRTREFAVRMALGSTPARLVSLIVTQGRWPLLAGTILGLSGGFGLSAVFMQLEPTMNVVDPVPLAVVLGTFVSAIAAAHAIPAVRAVRGAPAQALKD